MEWRDRIFSSAGSTDDPHYLTFSPYEPKVHEPVRQAMMADAKRLEHEEEEVGYKYIFVIALMQIIDHMCTIWLNCITQIFCLQ